MPRYGVWRAEADLVDAVELSGGVTVVIGGLELVGTVRSGGVSGSRASYVVIGGADGWAANVGKLSYHTDSGVRASTVISDAATAAGETLGAVNVASEVLGPDYWREAAPARQVLDDLTVGWWVDTDGVTQTGERPTFPAPEGVADVSYDPATACLELAADDLTAIAPGMTVDVDGATVTVQTLTIEATAKGTAILAWCNTENRSRVADLIRAIAAPERAFGVYEYRVVSMAGNRVNLQAVDKSLGIPDLSAVSVWTAPGISAQLVAGATVAVSFLNGDRSKPIVMACTPPDRAGHEPDRLDLGGEGGVPVARVGDTVSVMFPAVVPVSGTLSGAPFVGTMQLTTSAAGIIQGGSLKVNSK